MFKRLNSIRTSLFSSLLHGLKMAVAAPAITFKLRLEGREREEDNHISLISVGKQTFHS